MEREANVHYPKNWPFGENPWPWCPMAEIKRFDEVIIPARPHDSHMVNEGNTECPGVPGLVKVEEPKIRRHHNPKKMAALIDWLASLDDPESLDFPHRHTVTLDQIIREAKATFVDRKY